MHFPGQPRGSVITATGVIPEIVLVVFFIYTSSNQFTRFEAGDERKRQPRSLRQNSRRLVQLPPFQHFQKRAGLPGPALAERRAVERGLRPWGGLLALQGK